MALFHLSVTQTKRSAGQSAIASAAYRAGERLYSEYYGEYSDYTRKGGVICSDILLPSHAPPEYADRQTLWNAVEKAERGKNAQLAYSFDIALQNEFSLEENIALARQFLLENFVSRGMVVDFAVHQPDREDGGIPNPHFHVLCPIRPIEQNGKWGLNCSPFGVLGTRYIQIQYLPFHRSSRKRTQAFFRPSCPGFRYSQGLCLECF